MSRINILGTGCAMVTNCFNTCFTISNNDGEHFLIDTGGGNTILNNLKAMNISVLNIRSLFVSHTHNDHITGISWIIRSIAVQMNKGNYQGIFTIYGEKSVIEACRTICTLTLGNKFTKHFDERIKFFPVEDNMTLNILNNEVTFFDIHSTKCLQYGFKLITEDNVSLCFLGDEPYREILKQYAENCDFLMHEAFCLYEEREIFSPYEKHHSTVKECSENAEMLNAKNLIIIHTMDNDVANRKTYYCAEADYFCKCNVIMPDDMEVIGLTHNDNE